MSTKQFKVVLSIDNSLFDPSQLNSYDILNALDYHFDEIGLNDAVNVEVTEEVITTRCVDNVQIVVVQ